MARFNRELAATRDAKVFVLLPQAVRDLGSNAGFTLKLQDLGGVGQTVLTQARETLIEKANEDPRLSAVRASGPADAAQVEVNVDDRKAAGARFWSTLDVGQGSCQVAMGKRLPLSGTKLQLSK